MGKKDTGPVFFERILRANGGLKRENGRTGTIRITWLTGLNVHGLDTGVLDGLTQEVDEKNPMRTLLTPSEDSTQNRQRYAMDMRYIEGGSLSQRRTLKTPKVKTRSGQLVTIQARKPPLLLFPRIKVPLKKLKIVLLLNPSSRN